MQARSSPTRPSGTSARQARNGHLGSVSTPPKYGQHSLAAEFSSASDSDGIQPFQPEFVTDHLPHFLIQPKCPNCRTSHGRQPPDLDTVRDEGANMCGEMLRPGVLARMKERHHMPGPRIDSRQVGTLLPIADPTGERKVVK